MSKDNLVFEDFKDHVGTVFTISENEFPPIPLTLEDAKSLPDRSPQPGRRPPFALTFLCEDPRVLPQRMYRLAHGEMGDVTLFIVPVSKDARGFSYQALFN